MKPRAERTVWIGLFLLLPILVLPLLLGIGEDPNMSEYEEADVLSVIFDYRLAGFDAVSEGDEFPVSITLDPVDQERYDVAASHRFVSEGLNNVELVLPLDGFPADPQDPANPDTPFGCLGPIELADENGRTIMTITDFCNSSETPGSLRLYGDFTTGEGLGWHYRTPTGEVIVEVDAE